jgi:hypothetical protein
MMTETIKETLTKIKEVADKILEDYHKPPKGYVYNQYKVADVCYNLHLDGEEDYSVVICEISPTATKFQEYMIECLKDKLGFPVSVILEW